MSEAGKKREKRLSQQAVITERASSCQTERCSSSGGGGGEEDRLHRQAGRRDYGRSCISGHGMLSAHTDRETRTFCSKASSIAGIERRTMQSAGMPCEAREERIKRVKREREREDGLAVPFRSVCKEELNDGTTDTCSSESLVLVATLSTHSPK